MIDIHAHILADTDDGTDSFEESVAILYEAKKAGFSGVVCTPHYIQNHYEKNAEYVSAKIQELKFDSKRIGINLYQGNEIYASNEICKLLDDKKVTRINNSRYLLIEFPLTNDTITNYTEIIKEIIQKGYIPIIAHPERYSYIQKNIKLAKELLKNGALLQANYASIAGYYGVQAQKTIIKLLKNNMIQFLGSDVHKKKTIYTNMQQYIKGLTKYISEDKLHELSYKNPIKVINDDIISIDKN